MKKRFFTVVYVLTVFIAMPLNIAYAGGAQAASSDTRGRYLAGRGIIMPPEEVYIDSFLASIDYHYPRPQSEMGVYLYNSSGQMSRGQEGILQIGIQGRNMSFAELSPMNQVFLIDCSDTMNEEDKIAWVREAAVIFINKVRPVDSVALVSFGETARAASPGTCGFPSSGTIPTTLTCMSSRPEGRKSSTRVSRTPPAGCWTLI